MTGRLEVLVREGNSSSSISRILNAEFRVALTRNAVVGKCHRMGLNLGDSAGGRPKSAHYQIGPRKRQTVPRPIPQPKPEPEPPPIEVELEPLAIGDEQITVMNIRPHMCRWPFGDPQRPDFRFCGRHAPAGLSYCRDHTRKAYQPASARNRRLQKATRGSPDE